MERSQPKRCELGEKCPVLMYGEDCPYFSIAPQPLTFDTLNIIIGVRESCQEKNTPRAEQKQLEKPYGWDHGTSLW